MTETRARVLFIGGSGRSGSTIIDSILGQLPGYCSVGELRYIWTRGFLENRYCGCGEAFRDCPFWTSVLERAFGKLTESTIEHYAEVFEMLDKRRNFPSILYSRPGSRLEQLVSEYSGILAELYSAIASEAACRVVVDSSKHPNHAAVLSKIPSLELSVVHLVRDSRAVAFSWDRKKLRRDSERGDELMGRYSALQSARGWVSFNVLFDWLKKSLKKYNRVRYEDFVTHPIDILSDLANMAGESPITARSIEQLGTAHKPTHTVSGNPIRFESGGLRIKPDFHWRTEMKRSRAGFVTLLTFPWLLRYGYELTIDRSTE